VALKVSAVKGLLMMLIKISWTVCPLRYFLSGLIFLIKKMCDSIDQ
jgi:hypothetical protein